MTKALSSCRLVAIVTAFSALTALPLTAQSEAPTGKLKDKVVDALKSIADGTCPEKLLSALLLDQCELQLEKMQPALKKMGSIKEARFRGTDQLPTGMEAEVYRITFANGRMTWMAAAGPNGKLTLLWTPAG